MSAPTLPDAAVLSRAGRSGRLPVALASRGDALTGPLARALADRHHLLGTVDADLSATERYLVGAATFRPSRRSWVENFYKSDLAYRLRSRRAAHGLRRLEEPLAPVLQVHTLFELAGRRTLLYVDCTHQQSAEQWPDWNPLSGADLAAWYARERDQYHRAAHIFSLAGQTTRSLVEDYGVPADRVTTVWAGVNFDPLPDPAPPPGGSTILFVGNDFVRKGGPVLLQAFRALREVVPDARLQIVGTRHRIDPQPGVQVLGRVDDRRVMADLYRQAAVFALPSVFDPMPLVVLEAMSFGLPVVASRSCGIPEMVLDGRTGHLVDAGDGGTLAAALLALLRSPHRAAAMGAAGRARVQERFRWSQVVDRMTPALAAAAGLRTG